MPMDNYIKKYRCRLVILTPTHIGCGEEYSPQDFYVRKITNDNKNPQYVGINFHPNTMFSVFQNNPQARVKFESLLPKSGFDPEMIRNLFRFHNEFKWDGRAIGLSESFISHYNQVMNYSKEEFSKNFRDFQIQRTFYNHHTGEPVIPGSSIKGAIRTVILAGILANKPNIKNNPDFKEDSKKKSRDNYKDKFLKLQSYAFLNNLDKNPNQGTIIKHDPLSNLIVSDFHLKNVNLSNSNQPKTFLTHIIRIYKKLNKPPILPIIAEWILNMQYFEGTISFRSNLNPDKKPLNIQDIQAQANDYYNSILSDEMNILKNKNIDSKANKLYSKYLSDVHNNKPGNYFLLRLGRYKGAESQTIPGYREISIQLKGKGNITQDHATTMGLVVQKNKSEFNDGITPGWVVLEWNPM